MFARIGSVFFWLFIGILCIAMFPIAVLIWLLTVLFDRRLFLLHKFTCFWASWFTWPNPQWSVRFEGKEHLRRDGARIIVSNHLSLVDIPAAFRSFLHFKWVSKAENFKIPFVGWNMRLNRYIQLTRGSNRSNARMLQDCERTLAQGSSVYIFPEGSRAANGRVSKFKRGAFELAKRTGAPILPIVIDGSAEALPKKGLVLRGVHRIRFRYLAEIPPERFVDLNVDQLTEMVEDLIRSEHEKMIAART
ncbi:MAG: 1-acyl-sn-glycerol-3-phosphate acyltransferase [Leptospirales bacterium]|nr:1-acyl-sn-glycerol-3-phosphate acyltransferase [Leptospirales bacterium]